jgi:dipeptidyl aminopeptidase/acylaminoacyl peptidase
MPDGRELLMTVSETQFLSRVMRIDSKGGEPVPVLGLGENTSAPSVWSNRLVYLQSTRHVGNVWRIPARKATPSDQQAEEFISSSFMDGGAVFSPDGQRIAFSSSRSGVFNTWTCSYDGSDPVQLTYFEAETLAPYWSPDGKQIVFDSVESGNREIYIIDAEGGIARRLTQDLSNDGEPSWSRDRRWIYFRSTRGGDAQIWKIPAEGGDALRVTENGGWYAEESWDGEYLYYYAQGGRIQRVPVVGGEPEAIVSGVDHFRSWALGHNGIYYKTLGYRGARHREHAFWYQEFGTAQNQQLYRQEGPYDSFRMSVSPGEEWLLFGCVRLPESDIMLAENFR